MRGHPTKTPERVAEAQRLRAQGLKWREIAERLGVHWKTAYNWVTDPDGSQKRARIDSYRGTCVECGNPTSGCNGRDGAPGRCVDCTPAHSRKLTRDWIIASIHEWVELFGGPPGAQDWNQHMARLNGRQDLVDRYQATGRPWPSTSAVQDNYGSWNEAIEEAGYEPCAPGQRRDPDAWRVSMAAAQRKRYGTDERRQRIADLYLAGLSFAQIGKAMGDISESCVTKHLSTMRDEGWDLPYRKPGCARPKAAA